MGSYTADLEWDRKGEDFVGNRYSRRHLIRFDGGVEMPGSSSPHVVPVPRSDPSAVDPEEAFVASIASCHMLWFLSIAAKRGHRIDAYVDDAEGFLEPDADGRMSMTRVTLRPRIVFSGEPMPSIADIASMHDEAHHACYIANSVKTTIDVKMGSE